MARASPAADDSPDKLHALAVGIGGVKRIAHLVVRNRWQI